MHLRQSMRRSTAIILIWLSLSGVAQAQFAAPGNDDAHLTNQPPNDMPAANEVGRREATLASREAHLELLRASISVDNEQQLRLENILQDEIAADRAAIEALRGTDQ